MFDGRTGPVVFACTINTNDQIYFQYSNIHRIGKKNKNVLAKLTKNNI